MRSSRFQQWLMVGAMLALPVMVHAQEATLSGTVTDTTGGALPGVTIQAVHSSLEQPDSSGGRFERYSQLKRSNPALKCAGTLR